DTAIVAIEPDLGHQHTALHMVGTST
ncbi:MAG: hypothetical protein RLZ14_2226, partial [Actinomycetota bacterium]